MANPVVHFEIISREAKKLTSFYGKTFGWKIKNMKPMDYGMIDTGFVALQSWLLRWKR